jgi:hypothetical protein
MRRLECVLKFIKQDSLYRNKNSGSMVFMSHSNINTLLARGRKAGLSTRELYAALSSRPPEGTDAPPGQSDSNGYVPAIDEQGHLSYHPFGEVTR